MGLLTKNRSTDGRGVLESIWEMMGWSVSNVTICALNFRVMITDLEQEVPSTRFQRKNPAAK